jgi:adenosylcobinamide-phosphate synthase
MSARLALAGLAAEAVLGWPDRLPHPVQAIGALLDRLDRDLNRPPLRRAKGVAALAVTVGAAAGTAAVLGRIAPPARIALASAGLAQRSLWQHVRAVEQARAIGDIALARAEVARIVGRDTAALDASGIATAAIESLAESFNDGVVAPALWLAVGGLLGLWAYKAVNTADSIIGHRTPRHASFGWAAARADDAMNLVPARIAGLLIVVAAGGRGIDVMRRDAHRHASPNAGWPEAAMAGALGLRLGGPVSYDGAPHARPWFGDGDAPAGAADIARALRLYARATALLWLLIGMRAWRR